MEPLTGSHGISPTYDTFEDETDENDTVHEYGDVLNEIGCGPFQLFVYVSLILSVISGFITILYSKVLPSILSCEDGWDTNVLKYLPLIVAMGAFVGATIFGIVADIFGRKKSLLACNVVLAAFLIGCAFAPNSSTVSTLFFFIGVGAGGSIITPIVFIAEVVPSKLRSLGVFGIYGIGLLGVIICLAIGIAVANEGWKVWLGVSAVFPLLAAFCSMCMPESPLFQLSQQESAKGAIGTLQLAVRLNKRYLPIGRLLSREAEKRGNPISAFQPKMIKATLLLLVISVFQGFIAHGVEDTSFSLQNSEGNCDNKTVINEYECEPLSRDALVRSMIDVSICLVAVVIGVPLNELLGRRYALLTLSAFSGLFSFLLLICMNLTAITALSSINVIIHETILVSLLLLTVELYDNEIRAVMLAMIFSNYILLNVIGGVAFYFLIPVSLMSSLIILGVLSVIGAIVIGFFPTETKSKSIE